MPKKPPTHRVTRLATPEDRVSACRRGYDRAWRTFREQYLEAFPFCAQCGRQAEQVDHIQPIISGGARFDHANLQALCAGCHSRKTCLEDGGLGVGRRSNARSG